MSLEKRCLHNFSRQDIDRGRAFFRDGAVEILGADETHLDAEIAGNSGDYRVTLDWSSSSRQKALNVFCECPRFEDIGQCKHLVAVMLAADAEQLSRLVPGDHRLRLHPMDEDEIEGQYDDDDDDFDESDEDGDDAPYLSWQARPELGNLPRYPASKRPGSQPPKPRKWQDVLDAMIQAANAGNRGLPAVAFNSGKTREIAYRMKLDECRRSGYLVVSFWHREPKASGEFGKLKPLKLTVDEINHLPPSEDKELLSLLLSTEASNEPGYFYTPEKHEAGLVQPPLFEFILPRLCNTGRFGWVKDFSSSEDETILLAWDPGPPWKFEMAVHRDDEQQAWRLDGMLKRGDETAGLDEPIMLMDAGLVVFRDRMAPLEVTNHFRWLQMLRNNGPVVVPFAQQDVLAERLASARDLPLAELPPEFHWEQVRVTPQPRVVFRRPKEGWRKDWLQVSVSFEYDGHQFALEAEEAAKVDRATRRAIYRDMFQENQRFGELLAAGLRREASYRSQLSLELPAARLMDAVGKLVAQGWLVEAEGTKIRTPGQMRVSVSGGVDWFDLDVQCDFGEVSVTLPRLLEALRKGERFIMLDDGSRGMLPEDWLARYAPTAGLGTIHDGKLRFVSSQAGFLDALLAAQPQVDVDAAFEKARQRLRSFGGITTAPQPPGFEGQLRDYQREGLGWLDFLREFSFGGCLADDMGLGKTVQVLALLEARRARRLRKGEERRPSLAVVPRSLVHNWQEEAARFTPKLKVLDYTGLGRGERLEELDNCDLLLTTYGTLRRDVKRLGEIPFDYAILDEAQAVKNAGSQAAKATRLIAANHRLAMTGTPVENHLGELWSLFEFLNPGMLGRLEAFKEFSKNGRSSSAESLELLAKALRPFILRRTKEQVLKELPEKTEQTLYCELEGDERKQYNELRDHYRQSLMTKIDNQGLQKSKIHVLEALLRLRQAACHPGLLDKSKHSNGSAKLDTLIDQLREVLDAGHKALVFSQFTSLLAIVRDHLDREKIVYEYLDGRTRKRGEKVARFQQDESCKLFLISLKAGGLGLNLTAADYVFILDPWWNPAVEAQAVDRAHRIGQTRRVFAYRLIARDTVEEKILELQRDKRNLAEAIISADSSLLRQLTADDLRLLLS